MSVVFIAEASSNYAQDLSRALRFVDAAVAIGCDAVRFQLFRDAELPASENLERGSDHRGRAEWELPLARIAPLAGHCARRGVRFSCAPFDHNAVARLAPYVAFFKIASHELLWTERLEACAATRKPVILSTGMAAMNEIQAAVGILRRARAQGISLLHGVSAYPTPAEQANLSAIEAIRAATGVRVGWSDHTRSPAMIEQAVHRWGASAVEIHLDLDGEGAEFEAGYCWLPHEIAPVIACVRRGISADDSFFKEATAAELDDGDRRADWRAA